MPLKRPPGHASTPQLPGGFTPPPNGSAFADTLAGDVANNRLDGGDGPGDLSGLRCGRDSEPCHRHRNGRPCPGRHDRRFQGRHGQSRDNWRYFRGFDNSFGDLTITDSGGDAVVTWGGRRKRKRHTHRDVPGCGTYPADSGRLRLCLIFVRCPIGTDKHR